jgi:hypothetical protein
MAYPSDGEPKRWQILEAIKSKLELIQSPSYHHDVKRVDIYETQRMALGTAMPAIAIVPGEDSLVRNLSCYAEDRGLSVDVYGAIRHGTRDDSWKVECNWLMSDIRRALSADLQLDGTAMWIDFNDQTVFDAVDSNFAVCSVGMSVVYRHSFSDPTQ